MHFIGGFVAGSAPQIGYNSMLQELALNGHLMVASPLQFNNFFDHHSMANDVQRSFYKCYTQSILPMLGTIGSDVPVLGLSHSLGGKMRVLNECNVDDLPTVSTCANIYLAFNNFDSKQSIDMTASQISSTSPDIKRAMEMVGSPEIQKVLSIARSSPISGLKDVVSSNLPKNTLEAMGNLFSDEINGKINDIFAGVDSKINNLLEEALSSIQIPEFTPNAATTWKLLETDYDNPSNIIFQFKEDTIDQSPELVFYLRRRGFMPLLLSCEGNHLTPNNAGDRKELEFKKILLKQINMQAEASWGKADALRKRSRSSVNSFLLPGGADGGRQLPLKGSWDTDNF